jgi:hypothetical protein
MFDQLEVTVIAADNAGPFPIVKVRHSTGTVEWVAASALYGIRHIGQSPVTDNYRLVKMSDDLTVATLRYNAGLLEHNEYTRYLIVDRIRRP